MDLTAQTVLQSDEVIKEETLHLLSCQIDQQQKFLQQSANMFYLISILQALESLFSFVVSSIFIRMNQHCLPARVAIKGSSKKAKQQNEKAMRRHSSKTLTNIPKETALPSVS